MDTCHICLEKSFNLNNQSICSSDDCFGYICKSCLLDLLERDISTCPICKDVLYDIQDPDSKKMITKKVNYIITMKDTLKNILMYLVFYSIGFSHVFVCMLLMNNNVNIYNSYESIYYIISLIVFPFIGIIVWYIWILILATFVKLCKTCFNRFKLNDESESDSESNDESDSDSDYNTFENIL